MKKKSTPMKNEQPQQDLSELPSRSFPGQVVPGQSIPLRVAIDRASLSNLLGHASEYPDIEVCGVLVGDILKDGSGAWVEVSSVIRGEGARERGSAVTFTNETWNHIHTELDERHPGKKIVGWYHTHPDFGVFLSDMDSFIHTNFFGHPNHIALVRDPVRGLTAIFYRKETEMVPLEAYWIDGLSIPLNQPGALDHSAGSELILEELRNLRNLISSLTSTVEGQSGSSWSSLAIVTLLGLLVLILGGQLFLGWQGQRMQDQALKEYLQRVQTVQTLPLLEEPLARLENSKLITSKGSPNDKQTKKKADAPKPTDIIIVLNYCFQNINDQLAERKDR